MSEEHNITAKDKLILTIVLITIFVGVFGLDLIGVIYSLSSIAFLNIIVFSTVKFSTPFVFCQIKSEN